MLIKALDALEDNGLTADEHGWMEKRPVVLNDRRTKRIMQEHPRMLTQTTSIHKCQASSHAHQAMCLYSSMGGITE